MGKMLNGDRKHNSWSEEKTAKDVKC